MIKRASISLLSSQSMRRRALPTFAFALLLAIPTLPALAQDMADEEMKMSGVEMTGQMCPTMEGGDDMMESDSMGTESDVMMEAASKSMESDVMMGSDSMCDDKYMMDSGDKHMALPM